jgi:type IV pilus assembly protein PilA
MFARLHRLREEREGGFTLIELLVVIIIIGILAAIAIPIFLQQRNKGYDAASKSDLKGMQIAEESYLSDYNSYTTSNPALASEGFLATAPNGPTDTVNGIVSNLSWCLWSVSKSASVGSGLSQTLLLVSAKWPNPCRESSELTIQVCLSGAETNKVIEPYGQARAHPPRGGFAKLRDSRAIVSRPGCLRPAPPHGGAAQRGSAHQRGSTAVLRKDQQCLLVSTSSRRSARVVSPLSSSSS